MEKTSGKFEYLLQRARELGLFEVKSLTLVAAWERNLSGRVPFVRMLGQDQIYLIASKGVTALEPLRRNWLGSAILCQILVLAVVPLFILLLVSSLTWTGKLLIGSALLIGCLLVDSVRNNLMEKYEQGFQAWINSIFQASRINGRLALGSSFDRSTLKNSRLIKGTYDRIVGRGFLEIKSIKMSNIALEKDIEHRTRDEDGRTSISTEIVTVFDGALITVPTSRQDKGTMMIEPRSGHSVPPKFDRLKVASPDMSKTYHIQSDNPQLVYKILTPTVQRELHDFSCAFFTPPSISYSGGLFYILLPGYRIPFSKPPRLWRSLTSDDLKSYCEAVELTSQFIEYLQHTLFDPRGAETNRGDI